MRKVLRSLTWGVVILGLPLMVIGCDLQNPVVITEDETDPRLLINGALVTWADAIAWMVESEALAGDEVDYTGSATALVELNETGDLSLDLGYQHQFTVLSESRELLRVAIERARGAEDDESLYRALTYRGWLLLEMARRWGDQPVTGTGDHLDQEAIYSLAIDHFSEVEQATVGAADSIRHRALAGIAWAESELGRRWGEAARLERAVEAAEEVVTEDPDFVFTVTAGQASPLAFPVIREDIVPNPGFEHLLFWWEDDSQPDAVQYANADGLFLIQADAQLRLLELEAARATLEAVPLLRSNRVGLAGRDPEGPLLTDAEAREFIDGLDADELQFVVDELYRENWFLQGRRNMGPHGPIFPVELPRNVY